MDYRGGRDIEDEFAVQRDQAAGDVLVAGSDADLRRVAVDDESPEDGELVRVTRLAAHARQDGGRWRQHRSRFGERRSSERGSRLCHWRGGRDEGKRRLHEKLAARVGAGHRADSISRGAVNLWP